jgi:hypothetical protein
VSKTSHDLFFLDYSTMKQNVKWRVKIISGPSLSPLIYNETECEMACRKHLRTSSLSPLMYNEKECEMACQKYLRISSFPITLQ